MVAMLGKNQKILERISVEVVKEDDTYCYSINTDNNSLFLCQNENFDKLKLHFVEDLLQVVQRLKDE